MDDSNKAASLNPAGSKSWLTVLATVAGWVWAILAGGGGAWLLLTRGPWPLTNGWFALASGISACPLTGWVLRRFFGIAISGRVQFVSAMFFFIAGRFALLMEL